MVIKSLIKSGMSPQKSHEMAAQFVEDTRNVEGLKRSIQSPPASPSRSSADGMFTESMSRLETLMNKADSAVRDGHKLKEIKSIMSEIRELAHQPLPTSPRR